jgi:hypothetical protein
MHDVADVFVPQEEEFLLPRSLDWQGRASFWKDKDINSFME